MKVSLRGFRKRFTSNDVYETLKYIEKNLLNERGLFIGNITIYFTTCDAHGNYVVPELDQQPVAITHDYYSGEYLVESNPKERIQGSCIVPIDRFVSERGTLLPGEQEISDQTLAVEVKETRKAAKMTVRQLEQLTGIDGQILCEYENGIRAIPSDNLAAIRTAIHEFAEGNYELPSIDSQLAKIETFFQRELAASEKKRMIEYMNIGMTDGAIQAAIERTIISWGQLRTSYMFKILESWAENEFFGGDTRRKPKR